MFKRSNTKGVVNTVVSKEDDSCENVLNLYNTGTQSVEIEF